MTASRLLTLLVAIGLAAAPTCAGPQATEARLDPRPVAPDVPTYRAPAEPPDPTLDEPGLSAPAAPLALRDALALALMGNPELAGFSWETRVTEARALQAGKSPNMGLDIRLWNLADQDGQQDVGRGRVILSQDLELGRKRRKRMALADTERDVAGWEFETKRAEIAAAVQGRFVAVLGAQRRLEARTRSVEFFEHQRRRVSARVERGMTRGLAEHQVGRRLGLEKIDLQRAESDLAAARFALAATWGSLEPRFTEATGDLERLEPLPELDTILALAQDGPATARWEAEAARAEAAITLARATRVPDFTVGLGARWVETLDRPDLILDFEIDLPFFDRKQGDILEARYEQARVRAGQRAAAATRSAAIAGWYHALVGIEAKKKTLAEEVIPSAATALAVYERAFEAGAADFDDLLDARRDLTEAEIAHSDALVELRQALATLEGLVGVGLAGR